jgi:hypothetical protein
MAIPETELARVRRWCEARIPAQHRDQLRIEFEQRGNVLTILECRPPLSAALGPEWRRHGIARLRYTASSAVWHLFWRDRNMRFHRYEPCAASAHVADLLVEIERDPTGIFWG